MVNACKKLRLAQPTLSSQLKQFQKFLDKTLFERVGKKLVLTEDGQYVYAYAKSIFDLGQELADGLSDNPKRGRKRIQIGVTKYIPRAFIDTLLKFVFYISKDIHVTLVDNDFAVLIEDLKLHKLDMILNDSPCRTDEQEGVLNYLILKTPIVLCANNAWAQKIRKIPQDLNHAPMILPTSQSQIFHAIHEYFLRHKIKPEIIAEIQDLELVRRLVLGGIGIAPINQHTAQTAPTKEKLKILSRGTNLHIHDSIYIIRKKRKHSHPFVDLLLQIFKLK